jgi:HEAT repeat protein
MPMAFYDLSKSARTEFAKQIHREIQVDFEKGTGKAILRYFSDEDTYVRKNAYLAVGRIYTLIPSLQKKILASLDQLLKSDNPKVRQTVINSAGEIGMTDFEPVEYFFDKGLFDPHHSVRNAVIGSIKKMGEKNPKPVLAFAGNYLHHPEKEIRREICHGIELRGRKHPEDILPLLQELEFDKTARVRNTLIHVLGQIAYKKGCLEKVVEHLKGWENKGLVDKALTEIIDVHRRYRNFSHYTQDEAREYVSRHFTQGYPIDDANMV